MKTKQLTYILFIIIVVTQWTACVKDPIDAWSGKSYVWFTSSDTTNFTFASHADSSYYTVRLPITMAGKTVNYDREINISVVSPARNDSTEYQIIRPVVIPADSGSGYLKVRIHKTDNLYHQKDTIGFKINDGDQLGQGLEDYREKVLIISNRIGKPAWWDDNTFYMVGRFTELKLLLVMKVFGDDITATPFPRYSNQSLAKVNLYLMNKYLEENGPFYDYDGLLVKFTWGFEGY